MPPNANRPGARDAQTGQHTLGSPPAHQSIDRRDGAKVAFGEMPLSDRFLDRTEEWGITALCDADDPLLLLCAGWAIRAVTLAREVRTLRSQLDAAA